MSAHDSMNNENNEEYIDDSEGVSDRSYKLLKIEHEKWRQVVHDLKRKLELNEAMLREVQEANELLERSFDRQVSEKERVITEVEEKHRANTEEYENTISILETKLAEQTKEIEELQERAADNRRVKHSVIDQSSDESSFQADNIALRNRIDELLSIQREERMRFECSEETIEELKNRCDEFDNYTRTIKEQLDEKNRTLEDIRAELALKRAESASLEMAPKHESHKGNSLFAEVEDRRQNVVNKMNVLHEKYVEIKRAYKSQIAKMKVLKAEHVATLRKWENDAGHTLSENVELIQKYKCRISDLENKLKTEIKKNDDDDSKQLSSTNASFGYFQSLLETKKKETDELRIKVEDLSTKLLVQEETKINIAKELQYWRYKASSLEAQITALQAELKLDLMDDAEYKTLKELDEFTGACNNDVLIDGKQCNVKQEQTDSAQFLLSHYSPKIENTGCLLEKQEDCKARGQSLDKEKSNQGATVKFKIPTPEKLCEFKLGENTNSNMKKPISKMLRFKDDTTIEESRNLQKTTTDSKYPVLYIPTDQDN